MTQSPLSEEKPESETPAFDSSASSFAVDRLLWALLLRHGPVLCALLLALLLHGAVLLLGVRQRPHLPQRQPREALSVLLQAAVAGQGRVLTTPRAPVAMPASPARTTTQHFSRRAEPKRAPEVLAAMEYRVAPPPVLEYWTYAQPDYGYWSWKDLDRLAGFTSEPALQYPPDAEAVGLPGRVLARAYINERGQVDRVEITEALPVGIFESAVLQALYPLQFVPAERGGVPVKSFKELEIRFAQDGSVGVAESDFGQE